MRKLRVNFDTFGDENVGSSRLRAFMIAEELGRMGHEASIRGSRKVDIQVFQKVRNPAHVANAKQQGSLIVYDFDDHYLLDAQGTRNDVLRFIAFADVVTVGSESLAEAARRFHPEVYLFENPLDIGAELRVRSPRAWSGKIGWFGNPCNLSALQQVDIPQAVTTITSGGDIEWELDTIDRHLCDLDLVLIPVEQDEWTLAKNANRLLKCIALGLPVVVSRTPEHERITEMLNLPAELLVGENGDWRTPIEFVRREFDAVMESITEARSIAFDRFGISATTERWLRTLSALLDEPASPKPMRAVSTLREPLHAVVANLNEPSRLHSTLESMVGLPVASTTVVSAQPVEARDRFIEEHPDVRLLDSHDDFFLTYDTLAFATEQISDGWILIIEAGTVLSHGFYESLAERLSEQPDASLVFFETILDRPRDATVETPPRRLHELLAAPFTPALFAYRVAEGRRLDAAHGPFCLWEYLIQLFASDDLQLAVVDDPVVLVDPTVRSRHPVRSYFVFARDLEKPYANELPHLDDEWERLSHALLSQIILAHPELWRKYASQLLPAGIQTQMRASRFNEKLREKVSALETAYKKQKIKTGEIQAAYDRRKAEVFELRAQLRSTGRFFDAGASEATDAEAGSNSAMHSKKLRQRRTGLRSFFGRTAT